MHQQRDALAFADVAQLGTGEVGVQVQHPGSDLGGAEGDVEEAPVVAAQNPDPVAFGDPAGAQAACQRVRASIELGERQRSELVDQANPVAVADCGDRDRAAQLSQPVERAKDRERASRWIGADHAGAPGVHGGA